MADRIDAKVNRAPLRVRTFGGALEALFKAGVPIPLGVQFIPIADGVEVNDPVEASNGRRVLELHPTDRSSDGSSQPPADRPR